MCRAENENGVAEERVVLQPAAGATSGPQTSDGDAVLRLYPEPAARADGSLLLDVERGLPLSVSCVARVRWHGVPAVGALWELVWELPAHQNQSDPGFQAATVGPLALLSEDAAATSTLSRNLSFASAHPAHAGNYTCSLRAPQHRNTAVSVALGIVSDHVMCMHFYVRVRNILYCELSTFYEYNNAEPISTTYRPSNSSYIYD